MGTDRHTKGIAILDVVRTMRALHKAGKIGEVPPNEAKYLTERIVVSVWYPLEDFLALLDRVHQAMGGSDEVAAQMGEFGAYSALNGVHKIFLRPGDIEGTVRAIEKVWEGQMDFGQARVDKQSNVLTVTVDGYPDVGPVHGHLLAGWVRKAVELAGGDPASVTLQRAPWLGDPSIEVAVSLQA